MRHTPAQDDSGSQDGAQSRPLNLVTFEDADQGVTVNDRLLDRLIGRGLVRVIAVVTAWAAVIGYIAIIRRIIEAVD
jgi:hypothetical protein